MTNDEYIKNFMKQMKCQKVPHFGDNSVKGEHAIIGVLSDHLDGLTPGELSEILGVSTARIAAALNSLEAKALIIRKNDQIDKRKIYVLLTDKGESYSHELENKIKRNLVMIINSIGQKRFNEFIETSNKIRELMERNQDK